MPATSIPDTFYSSSGLRVLFVSRKNILTDIGGDSVQMMNTAQGLRKLQVDVDIFDGHFSGKAYDLIHIFNIIRPADVFPVLAHYKGTPYVISTIYVDYSEFERKARKGVFGLLAGILSPGQIEYFKYMLRHLKTFSLDLNRAYVFSGHRKSVKKLAEQARALLPNSESELRRFMKDYPVSTPGYVIPNGIDGDLFKVEGAPPKENNLVICVGRIEGRKNQLNVIRALNNTKFKVIFIGSYAQHQKPYYQACLAEAASNISFINHINQEDLLPYYRKAKVHVLASWHETTGLVNLEAAACGCNIVLSRKGDVQDYIKDDGFYCEPDDVKSIFDAVSKAAGAPVNQRLRQRILDSYTWEMAAQKTLDAYRKALNPAS